MLKVTSRFNLRPGARRNYGDREEMEAISVRTPFYDTDGS